jgi:hypothetical protein
MELISKLPNKTDPTILSNVTIVRDPDDGKLSVWVAGNRMVGAMNVQITAEGYVALVVGNGKFRLAESVPAPVIYETKDNVIGFPLMDAKRAEWLAAADATTLDADPVETK